MYRTRRFTPMMAVAVLLVLSPVFPLHAQDAASLIASGDSHFRDGQFARARDAYSRVLVNDPDNVRALNNRGVALVRLGDRQAALVDLSRAVQLAPRNGNVWNNRANLYCSLQRHKESLMDRLRAFHNGRFNLAQAQGSLRKQGFFRGLNDGIWDEEEAQALKDWTDAGCPSPPADRLI